MARWGKGAEPGVVAHSSLDFSSGWFFLILPRPLAPLSHQLLRLATLAAFETAPSPVSRHSDYSLPFGDVAPLLFLLLSFLDACYPSVFSLLCRAPVLQRADSPLQSSDSLTRFTPLSYLFVFSFYRLLDLLDFILLWLIP